MHYTCRSFIGSSNQHSWSQYWENEPDDPQIVSQRGHLFALISLASADTQKEINIIGHDLITEISQAYFSSLENPPSVHLKNILEDIIQNPLYHHLQINLIIAVAHQSRLHLAAVNSTLAIFNRADKLGVLLTGQDGQINTISGPISDGDKFMLATSAFLDNIPLQYLKSVIPGPSVQDIEESLLSRLYSVNNQDNLAAVLVQVHTREIDSDFIPDLPPPSALRQDPQPPKKSIFISNHDISQVTRRKKLNFIVALILLMALSASALFGYRKNQSDKIQARYQELKTQLDQKLDNADQVKNLNLDSALELARQSQDIYSQIAALSLHSKDLEKYQQRIQSLLSQTGSADNFEPEFYYDTSFIHDNPHYSRLISAGPTLYLLDQQSGRIDSVGASQRNTANISLADKLKQVHLLTEINGKIYASSDDDIFLVSKNNLEPKAKVSDNDIKPIAMASWNGAIYLLDSNQNTIWKFTPNSSGFGSAQAWLSPNQKISGTASSMAINGKIWIVSESGQIQPFDRGSRVNFSPPQASFTQVSSLATTLESGILAFVDNRNLIYVFDKNGQSKAKYNLGDHQVLDVAINEPLNTIFLLANDQKIYKIPL